MMGRSGTGRSSRERLHGGQGHGRAVLRRCTGSCPPVRSPGRPGRYRTVFSARSFVEISGWWSHVGEPGVQISPEDAAHAGQILSDSSDAAAGAGTEFLATGGTISGTVEAGTSIRSSAAGFGESLGQVCADLVESLTGLGTVVQAGARTYSAVDSAATTSFGGMVPR